MNIKESIKKEFMVIKAIGVVYGDIGTSPIYTLAVIFALITPNIENIFGILSFVFWTLVILVTVQYGWLATSLSKQGEGGTVVLVQLLLPYLKNAKAVAIITTLGFIGISLMIGDGVITPAISILSAVEGIELIPGYEHIAKIDLLLIASVVAFALFFIQKQGIEKVAAGFGPIMVVWFFSLGVVGFWYITKDLSILKAIYPLYAIRFTIDHPVASFVMLADVILAATGGEALYADMGHLGRLPILKGWLFAFCALFLSYFGQGAFIIEHPNAVLSPLFEMTKTFLPFAYIPFIILTIIATVIASQAMISGIFSVLYQAMTTRIFPHFRVQYTSNELRTQIYVGSVNWFLFVSVIIMLFEFGSSAKLAAAYGLAVTGAMSITGLLMILIFHYRKKYIKMSFAVISTLASILFFASCTLKIPHGAYWSLVITSIPLLIVIIYATGQKKLYEAVIPVEKEAFLHEYNLRYAIEKHLEGTAIFFTRNTVEVPYYIPTIMFNHGIIYHKNLIVVIKSSSEPKGIRFKIKTLAKGLELLTISPGYMEMVDIENILDALGLEVKTIFYGQEEIVSQSLVWNIFAMIKNLSPTFVSFYNFPRQKLIGVSNRVEI